MFPPTDSFVGYLADLVLRSGIQAAIARASGSNCAAAECPSVCPSCPQLNLTQVVELCRPTLLACDCQPPSWLFALLLLIVVAVFACGGTVGA